MCVRLWETDAVNEYRLRVAPEATEVPTDWNVIGARIIEAAERACVMHLHMTDGQLALGEIEALAGQSLVDG